MLIEHLPKLAELAGDALWRVATVAHFWGVAGRGDTGGEGQSEQHDEQESLH
jgi:hypothetical protein